VRPHTEEFQKDSKAKRSHAREARHRWKRPRGDVLKVNCDGAYMAHTKGGWGFVIRNSWGEVVKAGAGHVQFAMDAFQTEVMVAWEAIKSAIWRG
jgi:hypothetical protein